MSRRLLALVAAGVLAVGSAACGDDDDDGGDGSTTAVISEEEFVSQGNEICAAGNEEIDQGGQETLGSGQPTPEQFEEFVTGTVVPSIQGQIDDIRALGAPEGMEEDVNRFLDDAQTVVDELTDDPSLITDDPFDAVNMQAVELGLDECAG